MKAYVMNEGDQGFTDIYLIGYKYWTCMLAWYE
jgi:hypothetical protein